MTYSFVVLCNIFLVKKVRHLPRVPILGTPKLSMVELTYGHVYCSLGKIGFLRYLKSYYLYMSLVKLKKAPHS